MAPTTSSAGLSFLDRWITTSQRQGSLDEAPNEESTKARVGVMFIIFIVSLFASSFPSVSKRVKFLRIPRIVFFIGKHFGTGVILSTAFVHLLQDAFSTLQNPAVKKRWPLVGHWVGLIVLGSLLCIFVVEYVSTSYVDRLHSFESLPSSPDASQPTTPLPEESSLPHFSGDAFNEEGGTDSQSSEMPHKAKAKPSLQLTENTPLLQNPSTLTSPLTTSNPSPNSAAAHSHSSPSARRTKSLTAYPHPQYTRSQSNLHAHAHGSSRFFDGHHRHESRESHDGHHVRSPRIEAAAAVPSLDMVDENENRGAKGNIRRSGHGHGHGHGHDHGNANTHGHTHGLDFGSDGDSSDEDEDEEEGQKARVGKKRQVVGILVLQMGIMLHSLVIGLTLAITSGSEFTSLVTAIIFHQLFEGLSLGIRISCLPSSSPPSESQSDDGAGKPKRRRNGFSLLKTTLMFLFAITTPLGIVIGLAAFARDGSADVAHMKLTQGLMCAISAGMLIYAACVEMLAGDFVMDATLWRSGIWKQILAIASLALGVAGMSIIGWQ